MPEAPTPPASAVTPEPAPLAGGAARPRTPLPYLVLAIVLMLLAVAAGGWTLLLVSVEYRFLRVAAPTDNVDDRTFLRSYSNMLLGLLKLDPSNGRIRNQYASVISRLGDRREAVEELNRARLTENLQGTLFFLADMYEKLGDLTRAEQLMADCVIINPTNPSFTPTYLRMLSNQLHPLRALKEQKDLTEEQRRHYRERYEELLGRHGLAARDWAVRAPNDPNSHLFMGNFYVDPLFGVQAYRCYLMGLSRPRWMVLNRNNLFMTPAETMTTINQIIRGQYAFPYLDLP
ncbi:MAG TPA: hypothetical protein PK847_00255 [Candidatus Sumerlaeota bacterium]|nr:hypothetical protein [Candidatus Sumerlaeota bacterium]